MLRHVRDLSRHPTDAERRLWRHLRRRPVAGFRFRRQHPVGPYICAFAGLERWLVIELDGSQHVEQSGYDARRDAYLRSRGFRVLRLWNGELENMPAVLDTIFAALHRLDMDGRCE